MTVLATKTVKLNLHPTCRLLERMLHQALSIIYQELKIVTLEVLKIFKNKLI